MKREGRIIIVEDDRDINELIAYNLRREGFSVEQVFDGSVAQRRLRQEQFDTVILDIMLPGVDGFVLCRELKSTLDSHRTFVVMVSAKADSQDKLYAHILGADYYLTKPFSIGVLVHVIKELDSLADKEFLVKAK